VKAILEERCTKDLINGLKNPNSYQGGTFRFVSTVKGKNYPGIIDSLYMNLGFKLVDGDTIYNSRYTVVHLFLAKNPLGVEMKGMVRAQYDSHLKLVEIRDWSEREEREEIKNFVSEVLKAEELKWVK